MTSAAGSRPAANNPQVTAGLKCPPEIGPTAYAIASTIAPMANATVISPADGAENSAAPQTELTSANVPMTSAAYFLLAPMMDPLPRAFLTPPVLFQIWQLHHNTS